MTPPVALLAMAALLAVAAWSLGVWVERVRTRRRAAELVDALAKARAQAACYHAAFDQANGLLSLTEAELARARAHRDWAVAQVEQALRVIADLSELRVADAGDPFRAQWVAPTPQAWAAFQEGREKPREN